MSQFLSVVYGSNQETRLMIVPDLTPSDLSHKEYISSYLKNLPDTPDSFDWEVLPFKDSEDFFMKSLEGKTYKAWLDYCDEYYRLGNFDQIHDHEVIFAKSSYGEIICTAKRNKKGFDKMSFLCEIDHLPVTMGVMEIDLWLPFEPLLVVNYLAKYNRDKEIPTIGNIFSDLDKIKCNEEQEIKLKTWLMSAIYEKDATLVNYWAYEQDGEIVGYVIEGNRMEGESQLRYTLRHNLGLTSPLVRRGSLLCISVSEMKSRPFYLVGNTLTEVMKNVEKGKQPSGVTPEES